MPAYREVFEGEHAVAAVLLEHILKGRLDAMPAVLGLHQCVAEPLNTGDCRKIHEKDAV